ncbi:MAG: DUF4105 domain-containing protein [Candidatus Omnitrophica bacterium]|nr:DUF4105 domain-containing protein [Candidatus Omnitrophota bacterium]
MAAYYCVFSSSRKLQILAASTYIITVLAIIILNRRKTRGLLISLICFLGVALWFTSISPKADSIYPDHLKMPYAEIDGSLVTIHNVRNCDYRIPEDFDVHYETRTYDLEKLQTMDLLMNYWEYELIAHTFLSFGFSDGQYLTLSIEFRPETNDTYGMFKGLYKQYELIYIWADERDLVRLRTNYRKENVFLYRVQLPPRDARKLFMCMLERTNNLYARPEFYNTAVQSCTNTIGHHIDRSGLADLPWWKRSLLTGLVDKRSYNRGWLDTSRPFSELKKDAFITDRGLTADKDPDFSRKIRTHL